MDELVERVRRALAAHYPGAPNGRVRDVPDRRAIRWYATTGLVDRPAAMRGRTALYGPRHLLQLVAVKRRQAAGRTLAEIQAELAGASDATLAAIAGVPADLLADDGPAAGPTEPVRARFWAAPAGGTPPTATAAAATSPVAAPGVAPPPAAPPPPAPVPAPFALSGVALGHGAVLLVPGRPDADDCLAIASAARQLLAELSARGLLADRAGAPDPSAEDHAHPDRSPR